MLQDNIDSLKDAIKAAHEERNKRSHFWRTYRNEFIGPRWRDGLGVKRVSNYIYAYASTMLEMLFYRTPTFTMRSKYGEVGRVVADIFEQAINDTIKVRDYPDVIRACIFNSFYAFGMLKTGLEPEGYNEEAGLLPFACSVSPFRSLWDDTAKSFHYTQFVGHEFLMDMEEFSKNPRYIITPSILETVWTTRKNKIDDSVEDKSSGEQRDIFLDKMPPRVELVELYLRDINKITTLVRTGDDLYEIVRSDPYMGPPGGGYHMLGYIYPDNAVLPVAPAQAWWEQWVELERQEKDLLQQVINEKRAIIFKSADAAKIVKEAKKDSIIVAPEEGNEKEWGGATDQKLLAVSDARMRFEYASGLSDSRRGVGSRTQNTATGITLQDRYANIGTEGMQQAIAKFAASGAEDWKFYMWHDENVQTQFTYTDPQTRGSYDMQMTGGASQFEGMDVSDFMIEVDPTSFTRQSGPLDRQYAVQELTLLLGPIAQFAAMQGYMLDLPRILKDYSPKFGSKPLEGYLIPITPIAQQMFIMAMQKSATPDAVTKIEQLDGAFRSTGAGQQDGALMSDVMSESPTMQAAGKTAAPITQSQRGY